MPHTSSEFLKRHEIVRAGAGAGKTYTLTHKVMDIAASHRAKTGQWPRVVVTTFTRKATQELRERLMILALDERPELVDFVNSRSHLMVSTIHGVMDLYLKRYGAKICVDPGYTVVSGPEATKLARQVLRTVVLSAKEGERKARGDLLEAFPFNALTTLVRKLDAMWAEHESAHHFTPDDFESLFAVHAAQVADDLSLSATEIRSETDKAGWTEMADTYLRVAQLLRAGKWRDHRNVVVDILSNMKTAKRAGKNPPVSQETSEHAKLARKNAKSLSEPAFDPATWDHFSSQFALIEQIAREFSTLFSKQKSERGWLEIGDLELRAMESLRLHPETATSFASEWDHWLVDEYQDTSPFQVELLRRLTGEAPCFVVGDPQQSIYLFRGARSDVFAQREKSIVAGGGVQRLLSVNRRSCPELLLFFNDFFAKMDPPFQAMKPFPEDGAVDSKKVVAHLFVGGALSTEGDESKDDESQSEDTQGDDTENEAAIDGKNDEEMKAIVAHVQTLLDAGNAPEDICVLARTNKVLDQVAVELSKSNLPTHVHAAAGFFDRRETRDALAVLKFFLNPQDSFNLIELLRSPWFRVVDQKLVEITKEKPTSLWDRLIAESAVADGFEAISRLQKLLEQSKTLGVAGALKKALIDCGFLDFSHRHDSSGRRESNVWKLLQRLEAEEARAGFNPLAFVAGTAAELKLEEGSGEGDAVAAVEPDRINLMTIHASKGLEFKHVILPRMDQRPRLTTSADFVYNEELNKWASRIPFGENSEMTQSLAEFVYVENFKRQELQEHARVLYVALTRAVESVLMTWTGKPQKNSWAEMVRLDSLPGIHERESYSYQVHETPWVPRSVAVVANEVIVPRPKWLKNVQETVGRELALSVTALLDRQKSQSNQPGRVDQDVAMRIKVAADGTAVHRLMELLKYPSQDRMHRLITKWFPAQEERVRAAIEFVRQSKEPTLLEIIANGEVEWGFSVLEQGLLIEGQIDLWGRTNQGDPWIIDYKTGSVEHREKAFEQMSLYALALRASGRVGPAEKLSLAAVYPMAQKVFVQTEPSREQILARFNLNSGAV